MYIIAVSGSEKNPVSAEVQNSTTYLKQNEFLVCVKHFKLYEEEMLPLFPMSTIF